MYIIIVSYQSEEVETHKIDPYKPIIGEGGGKALLQ